MQMPGLDGVETSTEIRRRGYGSRIVAVTANASRRDERRCRKAGMNGFVRKPFRAVDLVETLRSTPRLVEAEAWELAQAV
jgi:CheY-like chemotaxis protein